MNTYNMGTKTRLAGLVVTVLVAAIVWALFVALVGLPASLATPVGYALGMIVGFVGFLYWFPD